VGLQDADGTHSRFLLSTSVACYLGPRKLGRRAATKVLRSNVHSNRFCGGQKVDSILYTRGETRSGTTIDSEGASLIAAHSDVRLNLYPLPKEFRACIDVADGRIRQQLANCDNRRRNILDNGIIMLSPGEVPYRIFWHLRLTYQHAM
jgi:hypothetical protein